MVHFMYVSATQFLATLGCFCILNAILVIFKILNKLFRKCHRISIAILGSLDKGVINVTVSFPSK